MRVRLVIRGFGTERPLDVVACVTWNERRERADRVVELEQRPERVERDGVDRGELHPLTRRHDVLDHNRVPERVFTAEEANSLLGQVRPLVESLVEHRRALARARSMRRRIAAQVAGDGGGIDPRQLVELDERIATELKGVARCANAIHELGAVVKDPDEGIVDFPARRGAEHVFLCWQLGEDEIAYWHGVDEGFAGRKPLPLE